MRLGDLRKLKEVAINMLDKEGRTKREVRADCYYYNWGDNANFEYKCPVEYGPRCEFYDLFFSSKNEFGEGLDPDCSSCKISGIERRVE